MSDEPADFAAWHGLATNPTIPPAERLECALKALDGYEERLEQVYAELSEGERRGYRLAIHDLRNVDEETEYWDDFGTAADFLEGRLAPTAADVSEAATAPRKDTT